jgi:hypothetical protein
MPDELVAALWDASAVLVTSMPTLRDALRNMRVSDRASGEILSRLIRFLNDKYDLKLAMQGDDADDERYAGAVIDALVIGLVAGGMLGAEQELKVTAVVVPDDDAGRTINTPKARLRHNDPRLRRRRMR